MNNIISAPLSLILNRLHFAPDQGVTYLNNSKVACSTIKKSIWLKDDSDKGRVTFDGQPHAKVKSPFCVSLHDFYKQGIDQFLQSTFFSVVRNPFVRVLSAYLDKITGSQRDPAVWPVFARRFRLDLNEQISFKEFLTLLTSEHPSAVDWHFAPQYINILYGIVPLKYIGQMEVMQGTIKFLSDFNINMESHTPHATKALERIREFYNQPEIDLVLQYYATDFSLFGYSTNPLEIMPVQAPVLDEVDISVIKNIFDIYHSKDHDRKLYALEQLIETNQVIDTDFIKLDAKLMTLSEVIEEGDKLVKIGTPNRKYGARLCHELLMNDLVYEASEVLKRLTNEMYHS